MHKIYIFTQGCSHNQADSQFMKGMLLNKGYLVTDTVSEADIVILNTCTVKEPTQRAFFRKLDEMRDLGRRIIVAGCIPEADPESLRGVTLVGPAHINKIALAVEETMRGNTPSFLGKDKSGETISLPKKRDHKIIDIIPISSGCIGACSFCQTKLSRGALRSYPIKEITNSIVCSVKDGVKEIWLTSEDTGCYGFDTGSSLPELLSEIININGDFKVRVGMMNPNNLMRIKEELVSSYKSDKIYSFLHLPLQSGSSKVLKDMKRDYTAEDFISLVRHFKSEIQGLVLATDIIVGYPTETYEDYNETKTVIELVRPDILNLSRFWPRPKTAAAKLRPLPGGLVKNRSRELSKIHRVISKEINKGLIGWKGKVLITGKGKNPGELAGRNRSYKQVIIRDTSFDIGDIVNVEIIEGLTYSLVGKVVK